MVRWVLFVVVLAGWGGWCGAGEEEARLSAEDIPVSIVDTEVGDWVEYALRDGTRSRLTVVERWTELGDDHLVIRNEVRKRKGRNRKDAVTVSEETVGVKERVADTRDLGPYDFVTAGQVLVGDRRIDAVIVNYVEDGQVVRQSYFSDEVPVYGLIRGVRIEGKKKTVVVDLRDFGQSGEDED